MGRAATVEPTALVLGGRVTGALGRQRMSAPAERTVRPGRSLFSRVFGKNTVPSVREPHSIDPEPGAVHVAPTDPIQRLIALQHADGSWDLTGELAQAVGGRLADLEKALINIAPATAATRQAWATALALSWLERNGVHVAGDWRLLALKARRWLDGVPIAPSGGRPWLDAAKDQVAHLAPLARPVG